MFEEYLRRVYPNLDISDATDRKQSGKGKRRNDNKKENFVPLTSEEKANICGHQLDHVLQKIIEVERKGQDEMSEVRRFLEYLPDLVGL
jgi:hypothetical protein